VGTQIRRFPSNTPIGGWPGDCRSWQPLQICAVLSAYDELRLQPVEVLSDYKISYYAENVSGKLIEEMRSRLATALCRVELVYSSNRDLDVLPPGVNKGSATAFLASHWSFAPNRVFVSGDTGNDLAMFRQGFRGIVVANAHCELKRLNSPLVYQAKQPYAAGVLEGLSYWLGSDV
jgi:hydroxymethylpyrimidine pyrophosphatase-like HAD family hydrolase